MTKTSVAIDSSNEHFPREPIRIKELRKPYENEFGLHIDWDAVEERDRRISRIIRDVLGDPMKANVVK